MKNGRFLDQLGSDRAVSMPDSDLARGPNAATQTSQVYDLLRRDLLSGALPPGGKLAMRALMDGYRTGQTPLREALNRLAAEGLVESRDQRGFFVAGISQSELEELTKTRCWLEALALGESMKAATPEWEEDLIVAHHRLARTPRSLSADRFEDNPDWERRHQSFHRVLIGRCGSQPLIAFCEQLADRLYRYRRLSIRKVFSVRPVMDEHRAILDAVLGGDEPLAVSLLTGHYRRTAEAILGDHGIFDRGSAPQASEGG